MQTAENALKLLLKKKPKRKHTNIEVRRNKNEQNRLRTENYLKAIYKIVLKLCEAL